MRTASEPSDDGMAPASAVGASSGTLADDTAPNVPRSPPAERPERLAELEEQVVPLDRYELGGELAQGGLGRILRARDVRLDRVVALKELRRDDATAVARFHREIRITAQLQHPNIVPLHDAGRWPNGQPFYAMKLVAGKTLTEALNDARDMPSRLALVPVVLDVAEAMAYAHSEGILHRDLKPANVLVGPFGETVVIDWGLGKHVDEPDESLLPAAASVLAPAYETSLGVVIGTPAYMPPEQAMGGRVDRTADVYSLGSILYHVISGQSPYAEYAAGDVVARVCEAPPTPLERLAPDAPRDLVAIVNKAMARKKDDRYPTAREMAEELRRYTTGGLVGAYQYGLWELVQRFIDRQRALVLTVLAALVALAAAGVASFQQVTAERDRAEHKAVEAADARKKAEAAVDEARVQTAGAKVDVDPSDAVASLKRLVAPADKSTGPERAIPKEAASIAALAQERGVAERTFVQHHDAVTTIAFAPDGLHFATGGDDKKVIVWNAADGTATVLGGHEDRVTKVAYSPDGALLVSSSYDGSIRMRRTRDPSAPDIVLGGQPPVKSIAFSRDGKQLCSVANNGEVRVWAVAGQTSRRRDSTADRDLYCSFSPDGGSLLSGSHSGTLEVTDLRTGVLHVLRGHRGAVPSAVFSPDGLTIASGGEDGEVRLWPANGGEPRVLSTEGSAVSVVAFSPDGKFLAAAATNGVVRLLDVETGAARGVYEQSGRVVALAFSPEGRYLATSGWDKDVLVHDLHTGTHADLRGHRDVVKALAFSPDGTRLASVSSDKTIRLWNPDADSQRRVLHGHTIGVRTVAFSPDGKLVASGGHDNAVRIWNVETGASRVLLGHTDHVYTVVFSPDGEWVASSSDDRTVRLWAVRDDRTRILSGHQDDVEALAFSPDGKVLASASEDNTARLWPLDGGTPAVLEHGNDVTAVSFDPTGKLLATASRDKTVRLWDGHTGAAVKALRGHDDEVRAVLFSPDGKRLTSASADGAVLVSDLTGTTIARLQIAGARDLAFSRDGSKLAVVGDDGVSSCELSGEPVCEKLTERKAAVHAVVFLPDGRGLVTASGDGKVRIWDLTTRERRVLEGHGFSVFGLALSPDGATLASGSADADVRLWNVTLPPKPAALRSFLDGLSQGLAEDDPDGDDLDQ